MSANIKVYGTDWCGDSVRTRRQLDRMGVAYEYVNIDDDEAGEKLVLEFNKGRRRVPTVQVASEGDPVLLSVPSESELESELRRAGVLKK